MYKCIAASKIEKWKLRCKIIKYIELKPSSMGLAVIKYHITYDDQSMYSLTKYFKSTPMFSNVIERHSRIDNFHVLNIRKLVPFRHLVLFHGKQGPDAKISNTVFQMPKY